MSDGFEEYLETHPLHPAPLSLLALNIYTKSDNSTDVKHVRSSSRVKEYREHVLV